MRPDRKVRFDGNEIIDYWMGHGSLLLGHSHARSGRRPVQRQAAGPRIPAPAMTFSKSNGRNGWQKLVRSAEKMRFVNSGTEGHADGAAASRGSFGPSQSA